MADSTTQTAPYRPTDQALGGTPTIIPDIPICGAFMALYLLSGLWHQLILIKDKKMGRKFVFCGMMAGLSWIRLVTMSLRMAWAVYPQSIRLGIAAGIFLNVGTVLLYFVNLFFTQRIVRAQHPHFGWSKFFSPIVPMFCGILVLSVIMVIVVSIQSFYTLSTNTRRIDRTIQLCVETTFAAVAFVPLLVVVLSTLVRQIPHIKHKQEYDKFGAGSMRTKIILVCITSFLLTSADAIKAGTSHLRPIPQVVPGSDPLVSEATPWYFSRGIFYGLGLAPEIIVLYLYALFRVNLRFYIPNGAKGPHSYAGGFTFAGEPGNEKAMVGNRDSTRNLVGSSPSLAQSNGETTTSGHASRRSHSRTRESVISWGGISSDMFEHGIGEDGAEMMPYSNIYTHQELSMPHEILGAEQELGWNPKSGRWETRPISTSSSAIWGIGGSDPMAGGRAI
ncbi:hypothetical protein AAFC00_001855 [Neodothiora populina]|uniref:Pheromone receptor n=1 Tax=Neodothiora populina TaxID=2781224 RepID=A0ABR3PRF4_9PEZI